MAALAGSQAWKTQSGLKSLLHLPFAKNVAVASGKEVGVSNIAGCKRCQRDVSLLRVPGSTDHTVPLLL